MAGIEAIRRIREKVFNSKAPKESSKSPQENPDAKVVYAKSKSSSERYGYTEPQRKKLKERLDSILGENNGNVRSVVTEAENAYGRQEVRHLGWRGSKIDQDEWEGYTDKDGTYHTPDSNKTPQNDDIIRLGIAVDFARQMQKHRPKADIKKEWIKERDMLLGNDERVITAGSDKDGKLILSFSGGLSTEEALKRVGPQDLGLMHEVLDTIARGKGESYDERYAKRALKKIRNSKQNEAVLDKIIDKISQGAAEPKGSYPLYEKVKKHMKDYTLHRDDRGK